MFVRTKWLLSFNMDSAQRQHLDWQPLMVQAYFAANLTSTHKHAQRPGACDAAGLGPCCPPPVAALTAFSAHKLCSHRHTQCSTYPGAGNASGAGPCRPPPRCPCRLILYTQTWFLHKQTKHVNPQVLAMPVAQVLATHRRVAALAAAQNARARALLTDSWLPSPGEISARRAGAGAAVAAAV